MANREPDTSGIGMGNAPKVYLEHEILRFIQARLRGQEYEPPADDELPANARLLRKKDVIGMLNISSVTLWKWEKQGRFPKGFHLAAGPLEEEAEAATADAE